MVLLPDAIQAVTQSRVATQSQEPHRLIHSADLRKLPHSADLHKPPHSADLHLLLLNMRASETQLTVLPQGVPTATGATTTPPEELSAHLRTDKTQSLTVVSKAADLQVQRRTEEQEATAQLPAVHLKEEMCKGAEVRVQHPLAKLHANP